MLVGKSDNVGKSKNVAENLKLLGKFYMALAGLMAYKLSALDQGGGRNF